MALSEDDQQIKYEWQDVFESQMDDDGDENINFLETLVFGDDEMIYNALDADTAAFVKEAINGSGEGKESREHQERSSDNENIQCANCGLLFTTPTFNLHVCTHDEFQEPIAVIPNDSVLLTLTRDIELIMIQNSEDSKTMQKDKITLDCKRCSRTFRNAAGLQRHYEYHIGEIVDPAPSEDPTKLINLTLCVFCGQVFAKEEDAWDHLVSSHVDVSDDDSGFIEEADGTSDDAESSENPAKKLKLDENNNQATTSKSPQAPIAISATQEPPKKSSAAIAMDLIKSVNLSKVYQCDFCDYIFACEKMMLRHVADHAPSSGYDCKSCELSDLTLKDILIHRRDECVVFRDIRNPLRDFARVWVCNVCSEEFRGVEQLVVHRHSNHHLYPRIEPRTNQLVFGCEYCSAQFATAPVLVSHVSEKHLKLQGADTVPKTSNRTPRSPSKGRAGKHQTSTRYRGFLCDVCGKSYTQSSHLWQHLRFHQGVKPFACTVEGCDRRFTIRPDLSDHTRKCHTGERPYLCTICNKRFLTGSVYYQHRLIHRGERRYGCDQCSKRFYRADALKNHERIHTGEKPYACHVCMKAFRQRGDRDKHMKTRHRGVVVEGSPKRARVMSYGRGRVNNNTSLYQFKPNPETVPSSQ